MLWFQSNWFVTHSDLSVDVYNGEIENHCNNNIVIQSPGGKHAQWKGVNVVSCYGWCYPVDTHPHTSHCDQWPVSRHFIYSCVTLDTYQQIYTRVRWPVQFAGNAVTITRIRVIWCMFPHCYSKFPHHVILENCSSGQCDHDHLHPLLSEASRYSLLPPSSWVFIWERKIFILYGWQYQM